MVSIARMELFSPSTTYSTPSGDMAICRRCSPAGLSRDAVNQARLEIQTPNHMALYDRARHHVKQ